MKNLKSILLVIAVMAAGLSFTSCEEESTPECVGSWEYVNNTVVPSVTYTYIIKDDGTYVYAQGATTEIGIYEYDVPSIVFVGTTNGAGIGTLSGRAMEIDNKAITGAIFVKK